MKKLIIFGTIAMFVTGCGEKLHSSAYYKANVAIAVSTSMACKDLSTMDDSNKAKNCRAVKDALMNIMMFCHQDAEGESQDCHLIRANRDKLNF